jgi:S-(hydroxymethyl)glutathione dehydrogenase / alcohol dehydrogenase
VFCRFGVSLLKEGFTVKVAVCYAFGEPLQIEEVEVDPPQSGEVKVRLAATAICHSDVHAIRGDWDEALPMVVGHEAAGIVEEIGEGVRGVQPGMPVVVTLLRSCGRCFYCVRGLPYHCESAFALQTESRLRNQRGERLRHGNRTAAFAEYTIVDQSQVVQVSPGMPLDRAALLACGVITGVGAVVNTAQARPGNSVVVIGVGGVGLNAVQGATLVGANPIIAIDPLGMKLAAARTFGATHTIQVGADDPLTAVKDLTNGRGADNVLVTVGNTAAIAQGLTMLRREGTLVIVGLPQESATASLPVFDFALAGQRILGSFMGSTRLSADVPWLVGLYKQGRLKLDELITARYPLEHINEAIASMEKGEALRNVIVFN